MNFRIGHFLGFSNYRGLGPLKMAQTSLQHFPRRGFSWVIITSTQLMLQSCMVSKNCLISGEQVVMV